MEKNIKLIYCILGSIILLLFSLPIFQYALTNLFDRFGLYVIVELILIFSQIVSFIGAILLMYYSIILIKINSNFKNK